MSQFLLNEKLNNEMEGVTKESRGLLGSKYGLWFLGLLSFVESMLMVPIITDPFMVAYILLHRKRVVAAVMVTTITSILGGLGAYITASFFIDLAFKLMSEESIREFYDLMEHFRDSTFVLGFLGALTPIPFTSTALVAGAIKGSLILFLIGAFFGRVIRYGIAGYLTYRYGEDALRIAKNNIIPVSVVAVMVAIIYIIFIM
ncbi:MAG: VTT domain-containing protein [Candidatus Pacebacteria bacterium]|nr:VTT domain-containing protein [Candidatus Paceibacterota bacterium]